MVFAATRMAWSSRSMSRSADSEAPTELSCSSRCIRSSDALSAGARRGCDVWRRLLMAARSGALLDADRPDFLHVRHAHQAFLHAVLLEGPHAVVERLREHL